MGEAASDEGTYIYGRLDVVPEGSVPVEENDSVGEPVIEVG
jgi:hypothetical protein